MNGKSLWLCTAIVGVANLATRWREAPLASPGGKLLSEARLMRGGDRSVYECSWMSSICSGFLHLTGKAEIFKLSPPLISHNENIGSEVPLFCCDSFPPGEAKGEQPGAAPIQRSAQFHPPAGRQVGDPYNGVGGTGLVPFHVLP